MRSHMPVTFLRPLPQFILLGTGHAITFTVASYWYVSVAGIKCASYLNLYSCLYCMTYGGTPHCDVSSPVLHYLSSYKVTSRMSVFPHFNTNESPTKYRLSGNMSGNTATGNRIDVYKGCLRSAQPHQTIDEPNGR